MKERVLKLCRRLDKFTLDEISTIAEDIDESVLELLLLTLVQEGKLIFKDNISFLLSDFKVNIKNSFIFSVLVITVFYFQKSGNIPRS